MSYRHRYPLHGPDLGREREHEAGLRRRLAGPGFRMWGAGDFETIGTVAALVDCLGFLFPKDRRGGTGDSGRPKKQKLDPRIARAGKSNPAENGFTNI